MSENKPSSTPQPPETKVPDQQVTDPGAVEPKPEDTQPLTPSEPGAPTEEGDVNAKEPSPDQPDVNQKTIITAVTEPNLVQENFAEIRQQIREQKLPPEQEAKVLKEIDKQEFIEGNKKLKREEHLSQDELILLAKDLVDRGFESSVAQAKILNETGQSTFRNLVESRKLSDSDLEKVKLGIEKRNPNGALKRFLLKNVASVCLAGAIGVCTGGVSILPIVLAGSLGGAVGRGLVDKLRSNSDRELYKKEVQGVIDGIISAQEIAKNIVLYKDSGGPAKEKELQTATIELVEKLRTQSEQSLEARKELGSLKRKAKWFGFGLLGGSVGAAAGVGIMEILQGSISELVHQTMIQAREEAREFSIRDHTVKYVHDAWHWMVNPEDIRHAQTVHPTELFRSITDKGEILSKAVAGQAHLETAHTVASGIMNQEVQKIILHEVLLDSTKAIGAGLVVSEALFAGSPKDWSYIEAKEGGEDQRESWDKTLDKLKIEEQRRKLQAETADENKEILAQTNRDHYQELVNVPGGTGKLPEVGEETWYLYNPDGPTETQKYKGKAKIETIDWEKELVTCNIDTILGQTHQVFKINDFLNKYRYFTIKPDKLNVLTTIVEDKANTVKQVKPSDVLSNEPEKKDEKKEVDTRIDEAFDFANEKLKNTKITLEYSFNRKNLLDQNIPKVYFKQYSDLVGAQMYKFDVKPTRESREYFENKVSPESSDFMETVTVQDVKIITNKKTNEQFIRLYVRPEGEVAN